MMETHAHSAKHMFNNPKSTITAAGLLVALGIIYGDIGTSPLYVMKAIAGERTLDSSLIYGGISCVFWTLTIQTTIKYIWLTLRADNQGEGGIFSLYALVRRYGKGLGIVAMIGATTLLADGIITPPISVASAVEGLTMIDGVEHIPVVPIVIVILSALFFFQRYGTQKIGGFFGPVMAIWFGMLFVLGIVHVAGDPGILRALNPYYGYQLLTERPEGFWLLGAVFLATTGAEALYSDLGHCGKKNIRITWGFVKVCLLFNYLGQGAWLLQHQGEKLSGQNPFFALMPEWFLIPGILIATLAAIIASQALISGSYTLISEAMNLNFWPRVAVRQPSSLKGQIYIPSINTILWVGCILMIVYFQSSAHMEAAYGFSITITMLMTTILLSYFLRYRLKWSLIAVVAVVFVFATVETAFVIANIAKIRERWMFLFFELFIFLCMYAWYNGRQINNQFIRYVQIGKYSGKITQLSNDVHVPKIATHLVYLTKARSRDEIEEKIMRSILSRHPKRADVYWFLHIQRTEEPFTLSYQVSELVDDKIIRVTLKVGFRVALRTEAFMRKILCELIAAKELDLHLKTGETVYSEDPDLLFVIIRKFLSVENEFKLRQGLLISAYFKLKQFGQPIVKAFGLEKNDVLVEDVPLIVKPMQEIALLRDK